MMLIGFVLDDTTEKENLEWERLNRARTISRDVDLILPEEGKEDYPQHIKESMLRLAKKIWEDGKAEFHATIKGKVTLPKRVTCVLTRWGCGGKFDTDRQQITIRLNREKDFANFMDTVKHEVLHLVTYREGQSYEDRENIVDELMGAF